VNTRLIALLLVALALAIAACGGDDEDGSPTASPSATLPPTATLAGTSTPTPTATQVTYTVQAGDTLYSIAETFGVTIEALTAANGIDDPESLQIGHVLVIPNPGATIGPTPTLGPGETGTAAPTAPPSGDVSLLQLVDKQSALPAGYIPPNLTAIPAGNLVPGQGGLQLRSVALDALLSMLDSAAGDGQDIRVSSAYRSYDTQVATFQYWVDQLGYDEAIRVSAMPGHSEHQLGTTVDLASSEVSWALTEGFGNTAAGQWLMNHAYEYGFALSYPEGKEGVTGYAYEPWHWRYIGEDAAANWHASGQTLNQFLAAQ
jgi:D-alanyl-D-alanine carboxypeptidase